MSTSSVETAVPPTVARRLVGLACRAPSVHNTQPWAWRIGPDGIDLYADHSRQLTMSDPDGRNLVISCGAALHHLQVAALATGWRPEVTRLPDPADPDLLAHVRLTPAPSPPAALEQLKALTRRCTDRRRFTSWPLPAERLEGLATLAAEWDVHGVALTDESDRFQVELLVSRALQLQSRDRAVAEEQRAWVHRGSADDGVPVQGLPVEAPGRDSRRSRFGTGELDDPGRDVDGGDGLVLLCAAVDQPLSWLRAGEALSALWLYAVHEGLSVVPLSQVVEVPESRAALQYGVLGGLAAPLLLVRVGWQAISRSQLEPTPRRPLEDVLLPRRTRDQRPTHP